VQEAIEDAKEAREKHAEERAKQQEMLEALQHTAVESAAQLRLLEAEMAHTDSAYAESVRETERAEEALGMQRKELEALATAMLKFARTPPEVVLAMPGESDTAIRAAAVLDTLVEELHTQSDDLHDKLAELAVRRQEQSRVKEKVEEEVAELKKQQERLSEDLNKRQALFRSLNEELATQEAKLAKLSAQSTSLMDLIANLEKEREAAEKAEAARPSPPKAGRRLPLTSEAFLDRKGKLLLPVSGKKLTGFGATDSSGRTSKGVSFRVPRKGRVVAPFQGEVVYTGPFMSYGKIVILRHSDAYHTLIAGLDRIEVASGQFVLEGEPLGAMGGGESGSAVAYLELRKHSKPMDPSGWFAGL
jgi:septal ring factor EnvC (AmiA/AmiB activator)